MASKEISPSAAKKEVILFLCPADFFTGGSLFGVGSEASINFYEKNYPNCRFYFSKEDTTTNPPKPVDPNLIKQVNQNFTKYEHLSVHSTFQLLFCHNVILPANLKYLDWKQDESGNWYVNYLLNVRATPGGIYYTFFSKTIFCQWKS